jgi:hypothetical protein
MFIHNKYSDCYWRLINAAKVQVVVGYSERHHIIPKSLGGTNAKDNLVRLTAKQHFVAHHLLMKMTSGSARKKMCKALWTMRHVIGGKLTARQFEALRTEWAATVSEFWKGRKMSPSHYANFLAGQALARANGVQYGGMHSEEHKQRMVQSNKDRKGIKLKAQPGKSAGSKNSRAKVWIVEDLLGHQVTHYSITPWCRENGITLASLKHTSAKGEFYKGFRII